MYNLVFICEEWSWEEIAILISQMGKLSQKDNSMENQKRISTSVSTKMKHFY